MTDPQLDMDVELLYKAMKGAGTDEDTLIKVTSKNKLETSLKIKSQYKMTYGIW